MASAAISWPLGSALADFWEAVPVTAKLAGHSLFVAGLAPEFKAHWLVHLVVSLRAQRTPHDAAAASPLLLPRSCSLPSLSLACCRWPHAGRLTSPAPCPPHSSRSCGASAAARSPRCC